VPDYLIKQAAACPGLRTKGFRRLQAAALTVACKTVHNDSSRQWRNYRHATSIAAANAWAHLLSAASSETVSTFIMDATPLPIVLWMRYFALLQSAGF
jgi:hypothetical protein